MTEAEREVARRAKNEYLRDYRRKNPEKTREAMERYWIRRAARATAAMEAEAAAAAK